ncbi:MAG TPA: carbohydrate ABC transporter permease, partial [Candidatus Paceibacterota bacterium]|nr:carbohydrate ABC transporter permease [Candidatus Paceibacterota bacterium]
VVGASNGGHRSKAHSSMETKGHRPRFRKLVPRIVTELILILAIALVFTPVYLLVVDSFKPAKAISLRPFSLPNPPTLANYQRALGSAGKNAVSDIVRMYRNSVLITSTSVLLIIALTPLAGYYLGRTSGMFANLVLLYFLVGFMIPREIVLIPLINNFRAWRISGTLPSMCLYYFGLHSTFSVLLYGKFVKTIPRELDESALIDGARKGQIFWRIVFPLLKPCTLSAVIFIGLAVWNDFLGPLLLLGGQLGSTITLGVYRGADQYLTDWGMIFAFIVLASAPMLILFLALQRWFIRGLVEGAVKG